MTHALIVAAIKKGDYLPILWFGGIAMGAVALIQVVRILMKGLFSANFVKLYGLTMVATLGAVLVVAEVDPEARTAGFTLLGAIAGYLAGAKATTTTTDTPATDAQPRVRTVERSSI